METIELLEIIARGEDSKHQFKSVPLNKESLAQEMIAFSNSGGGQIFIGVNDNGTLSNLTKEDVRQLNNLVSNTACDLVCPPINPLTENVQVGGGLVMIVTISDGLRKPYMNNHGSIWVKHGANKRQVTAPEEMQRILQSAGLVHGDEVPANGLTISDLDVDYFRSFFERVYGKSLGAQDIPLPKILENMNLAKDGNLNIAGALLFAQRPQFRLPVFIVKGISYPGEDIHENQYLDSHDFNGKLEDVLKDSLEFIIRNLRSVQDAQTVNSTGVLEIPKIALEELLTNALIHRDYFVSASVRIFVFSNRIEIVSPGHLPNNLTIENIKSGNSNIRNPILASFASKILPYRGLGSGILRALKEYPRIDFIDDNSGNLFKVVIHRR